MVYQVIDTITQTHISILVLMTLDNRGTSHPTHSEKRMIWTPTQTHKFLHPSIFLVFLQRCIFFQNIPANVQVFVQKDKSR